MGNTKSRSVWQGETESPMIRQRVRIRFRKAGDLRLIGHRDLVRTWERLLRRCNISLSMSEGFHPKPRMSFPSALAVGISGLNEILEVELAEPLSADELKHRLAAQAPPGLTIHHVVLVEAGKKKSQPCRFIYELPVPRERRDQLRESISQLLAREAHLVERDGASAPIDVRSGIDGLDLEGDRLRLRLNVGRRASVRPGEVLAALGAADLAAQGFPLQRTDVEVAP
jgi:radical SAM-linked protein